MKNPLILILFFCLAWLAVNAQGIQIGLSPTAQTVTQGGVTSFHIYLTPTGGFNQQLFLTDTSDIPYLLNISFSANNVYPNDTGLVMTVGVTGSVPLGQHWIAVKAANGPVT